MSNEAFTWGVAVACLFIGLCIFLVVRSLGKPVVLPETKPERKPVPARQPRAEKQTRAPRTQAPSAGRQFAPDDDIEFLRSLNTRPPQSD